MKGDARQLIFERRRTRLVTWALIALFLAAGGVCFSAPVKTSKLPWINTWAVEYYYASGTTLQKDAAYFDLHMNPHNVDGLKALAPNTQAIQYILIHTQDARSWETTGVVDRSQMDKWLQIWNASNAGDPANIEEFYLHQKVDMTVSGNTGPRIIPGWDPANDVAPADGIRDKASDWGFSTSTGAGFLDDTKKTWTSNQWANSTLVDKNGNSYIVTGNTGTRLMLSVGTPAAGRYGLSAPGSANPKATAGTLKDARLLHWGWEDWCYSLNAGNAHFQKFRGWDCQQRLSDDKSVHSYASANWDGFMADEYLPMMQTPNVADGMLQVIECPDISQYKTHMVSLVQAIRNAIGPSKYVIPNIGDYPFPGIPEAGGGMHQEMYVAPRKAHGPEKWDYWKQLSDKGQYSWVLPSWDDWATSSTNPADWERPRMHVLAFHYMGQQPYIYLGFRGFGIREVLQFPWTPYEWLPACEIDVGTAVDPMYKQAVAGTDGAGQKYGIYTRRYSKALIVCRPKIYWGHDSYGDNTAVTFDLPYYATSTGQSNVYKPLRWDGTFGGSVSRVTLRNVESYILFPADSASQPPDGDTVPPVISGVVASNIGSSSATIAWTTDEASTSKIYYGTTTAYGVSAGSSSPTTNHSVSLTGLQPSTTYHYRVESIDAAGNIATSSDFSFTTAGSSSTSAFQRDWLLLGPFDNSDNLGHDRDYIAGEATVTPTEGVTSGENTWKAHRSAMDLIDLDQAMSPNQRTVAYAHIYVNSTYSQTCSMLLGSDDGVKVWVNGTVVHDNATNRSALPDQDRVQVILRQGWNRLLVKIDQLDGNWGLYLRLVNSEGAEPTGLSYSLSDPTPPADTTPPTISSVTATPSSPYTAAVTWNTDEVATSAVEYGLSTSYGTAVSDPSSVTSHSVELASLVPGATYHCRVKSTDAAGNQAVSVDYMITTPVVTGTATFQQNWLVVGPFDNTSGVGYDVDYIDEAAVAPSEGDNSGELVWTVHQSTGDFIDLDSVFFPNDYVVAYAHAYVYSDVSRSCQLWLGSDDSVKVWLNGGLLFGYSGERSAVADTDKIPVTLEQGWNSLLVKVGEIVGRWGFYARICDTNGNPVSGLTYQMNNPEPRVPQDTTPPAVIFAQAANRRTVIVYFNEPVSAETANDVRNYRISPNIAIRTATLQSDRKSVVLKIGWAFPGIYTVYVTGVCDTAGNAIPVSGAVDNTATYRIVK